MKLMLCVDDRGDVANTQGLTQSVTLPKQVKKGLVEMVYEWKVGTPVPTSLPLALALNADGTPKINFKQVLDSWIPEGFKGMIAWDYEMWSHLQHHISPAQAAELQALFPDLTWSEAVAQFYSMVKLAIDKYRPGCKLSAYGTFDWHPDFIAAYTAEAAAGIKRDIKALGTSLIHHPVLYTAVRKRAPEIFSWMTTQAKAAGIPLSRMYPIINVRTAPRLDGLTGVALAEEYAKMIAENDPGMFNTEADVMAQLVACKGCPGVLIWDTLDCHAAAEGLEKWLFSVLVPCAQKLGYVV